MDAGSISHGTDVGEDAMILIIGPLYSGKKTYAKELMNWTDDQLAQYAVWDVQDLAATHTNLEQLAGKLSENKVVIATEIGGGIVPIDPQQRHAREAAGRLTCLLAQKATTVIRVFCGIPTVLKGEVTL